MGCCIGKQGGALYSSPAGKVLPPSPADELSEEVGEGSPPDADGEKARFASYYGGTAEEAQLRALKRGVVKFNVKPKEVRARPRPRRVPPPRFLRVWGGTR
jgi:hypothetical protein